MVYVGSAVNLDMVGLRDGQSRGSARHDQFELPALVDNHLPSFIRLAYRFGHFEAFHCHVLGVCHPPNDVPFRVYDGIYIDILFSHEAFGARAIVLQLFTWVELNLVL